MSDEDGSTAGAAAGLASASDIPNEQPIVDEHTTEPNPPQSKVQEAQSGAPPKWEMPKPVFQKTSGYLPQGFLKEIKSFEDDTEPTNAGQLPSRSNTKVPDLSAIDLSPSSTPLIPIEPQPDLSDVLVSEDPADEIPIQATKKKSGFRASMFVLGVIAILAFIAVFLTVIYFLFLKESAGTTNF